MSRIYMLTLTAVNESRPEVGSSAQSTIDFKSILWKELYYIYST